MAKDKKHARRAERDKKWTTKRIRVNGEEPKELAKVYKCDVATLRRCMKEVRRLR
jgi:hypothetical protein